MDIEDTWKTALARKKSALLHGIYFVAEDDIQSFDSTLRIFNYIFWLKLLILFLLFVFTKDYVSPCKVLTEETRAATRVNHNF